MEDNGNLVRLSKDGSYADASSYGAHLIHWQPRNEKPVLWLSPLSEVENPTDMPIRGGIPICLPWFGISQTDPSASMHGFARTAQWVVSPPTHVQATGSLPSETTLTLTHHPESPTWGHNGNHFPYRFSAQAHFSLGKDLLIELTVTNDDDQTIVFEEALHTYFAVGDIKGVTIEGLDGDTYQDMNRDPDEVYTQQGEITPTGPINRIYNSCSAVLLKDPCYQRTISISTSGSSNTVVWTPWEHGVHDMKDIPAPEWEHFICIESGNVRSRSLTLKNGESHTLSVTIGSDAMN